MDALQEAGAQKSDHTLTTYHMSYSLNSLKGGYIGDYTGEYHRGY